LLVLRVGRLEGVRGRVEPPLLNGDRDGRDDVIPVRLSVTAVMGVGVMGVVTVDRRPFSSLARGPLARK